MGIVVLVAGCTVAPAPSPSPVPPTISQPVASTSPSATVGSELDPPLNRIERKVIDALARLRIVGERAENPAQDASIAAELSTGYLFVNAGPTPTLSTDYEVIGETEIEGIRVQTARYTGSELPAHHRFDCEGDTYRVRGATPADASEMNVFIGRFIRALGCGR